MNRRGVALIFGLVVIVALTALSAASISRSVAEGRLSRRYVESTQAFWLSEAGVNRALDELRNNFTLTGNQGPYTFGVGQYKFKIENIVGQPLHRKVTAYGYLGSVASPVCERRIETVMNRYIPKGFYDHAIYTAGDLDANGAAYSVEGDCIYANIFEADSPENINGTVTQDPNITPLARLDFQQLATISQGQGNYYDAQRMKQVETGKDTFPTSFWYQDPTDPTDPTTGIPNIVYISTDMALNGSIGTIGGFYVVVGDVVTNPDDYQDSSINGNGTIEGAIYTRGKFVINGGGGALNINGGVWAGEIAILNGFSNVAYNEFYMKALGSMEIDASVQISSWKDQQPPYPLTP